MRRMPHLWDDGALLLGNEKTSVFFVDAKSGRMICSHGSDNSASTLGSGLPCDEEEFRIYANGWEDLLYVMRTDYEIWYYPPDSRDILWQVAFADVEAEFQCQAVVGEYHLNSELTADLMVMLVPPCHVGRGLLSTGFMMMICWGFSPCRVKEVDGCLCLLLLVRILH